MKGLEKMLDIFSGQFGHLKIFDISLLITGMDLGGRIWGMYPPRARKMKTQEKRKRGMEKMEENEFSSFVC